MSRKTVWILAAIMTGAVIMLVWIQYSGVRQMLTSREQQFAKQVMQSLTGVVNELERREVVEQVSNDVISVNFDTASSVSHTMTLKEGGLVIVDSILSDSARGGALLTKGGDSLYYPVSGTSGRPFQIDYQTPGGFKLQDKDVKEIILRNKTVFVENVINNLIRKRVNLEERINPETIKKVLAEHLKNNGIDMEFHFAVLRDDNGVICSSENLESDDNLDKYKIKLFPNDDIIAPECFLGVCFPDERNCTLASMKKNIILSVCFALIVIGIFSGTFIIILRQRKISEMRNDFVNNMTHELKTPISSISLASQMLKDPAVAKNEQSFAQISSVIEQECKKLGFQVERVLQMASIDKTKNMMKIKEIYVNELIGKVVKSFELKVRDKGGEIKCALSAKDDLIEGDEVHIGNLVSSLLDNALKYTVGTPELKVETSNVKKGIEIAVSDNGIGISHEDQKKVFDQFFRVHTGNIHNVKGFGIGLSYVKKVVDEHHGTIKVKSELNKGTTFFVYLPFNQ